MNAPATYFAEEGDSCFADHCVSSVDSSVLCDLHRHKAIYYSIRDYDYDTETEVTHLRKMSLSGTNKKSSSYDVSTKKKMSNKKGYKVKTVEKNGKCIDYLIKPNKKKIKLCSYKVYY